MSIGTRLKDVRVRCGLKQEELAIAVGVTKGAIGNYETGVSSPKESVLIKLMQVLSIDANYLYQDYVDFSGNKNSRLSESELRVLAAYRQADPTYQAVALELLESHPAQSAKVARA